jgi:predicted DNA binding protein
MKHVRVTACVDPDRAPAFFDRLANAPAVDEARVLDWNLTAEEAMILFEVAGDPAPLVEGAADLAGVDRVETSGERAVDGDGTHDGGDTETQVLVHVQRSSVPIFSCLASALASGGLIVRTPLVFRDGEIHARIVGDPAPLQEAFERQGDDVSVRIDEVASRPTDAERPMGERLSDRQREALAVATELGYYEAPREATHEDVAAQLGCSAQTAGDHLRKAEAKLVDAATDAFGPDV